MPPGSPAAPSEDPSASPVVPTVLPTVPDPYAETGPYVVQGPPQGPYNNITGTHGPAASRTVRERITPLTAGLAVAVLAAGAAALWFTVGGGGGDGGRNDARGRTASAPAEEATGPDAGFPDGTDGTDDVRSEPTDATATDAESPDTESPDAGDPPPGYVTQDDEEGFRIAVPEEWSERTKKTGGVFYEPFGSGELLQVFRVSEPGMTALDAVRAASEDRSVSPGFEEVRIGAVDNPLGGEAAELVYAYDSEDSGGRRRVLERVFTASDGRLYAVLVAAPDEQWPRHEEILSTAVTHFDPYDSPF
ncbi:serine/arginine repetitive matrix protein 2 [Streptomyces sp. ME02-6991-2A]|uniref:serine/arginine repetitive matrix protein 2 n=1 Tax=Streptomyces sp. ME02-6991-2A TaxID=3028677 RepID=UPI0029AE407B|nr:serine/arginine repetitive matrix protein 2 [Streptomyces sp. ME02-6991-2A]MDX3376703.1 serine/arginine repetitive matrix protein 2 [Streptomyces sp. ME02-6991-2A]